MIDRQPNPDLRALERNYEIVGELRGAPDTHRFVAHRRSDGAEVMITVVRAPKDDASNALAHLASDTQLLSNLSHARVPRVHFGQWLGAEAYAVISDPVHGPPLAESVSRGEQFADARVALILRDVVGVLDWARSHGIVHRKVTPETLWFESGTERVIVSFAPARIPISGVPDARGDARTIGVLAWSMLAGRRYDDRDDKANPPLAELCPKLARRIADATEEMIRSESEDGVPDVSAYLALVSSGDVLRRAEIEMAALQSDFAERHRIALAKYENQRAEIEAAAAEHAARLAAERAAFERLVRERQEQLAAIRSDLDKQRVEIARRLSDLEKRRAELETAQADVARRGATMDADASQPSEHLSRDVHWAIPMGLAVALLLLIAGLFVTMSNQRRPATSAGDVLAPRATPLIGRPAPTHTPPIRRPATTRDTVTPQLDTSTHDTTGNEHHPQ